MYKITIKTNLLCVLSDIVCYNIILWCEGLLNKEFPKSIGRYFRYSSRSKFLADG
mgnify:CR=1 FL=1